MAGKILIAGKDPAKLNVNIPSSVFLDQKVVKMVQTSDIKTSKPFIDLFTINEDVLSSIIENMREKGYDDNQPVIIWKEQDTLIDGHTRLQAAKTVGITSIPAVYASFENEDMVLDYMHRLQFNRRNIGDGDLIRLIINALPKYKKRYGEGSKAEFLIKRFIGLSETKAKQAIIVAEKADEKLIQKIETMELTIRNVYEKLKSDKNTPKQKVTGDFFDHGDEDECRIVRCDDKGAFYFRDYEKKTEMKVFRLPKIINHPRIREKIRLLIEEEFGKIENDNTN